MEQKSEIRYTYADYETWDDGSRWELIDGNPYAMSPAPSSRHQEVSGNLFALIHSFLRGKTCKVYSAPFDVRLNADTGDNTVVQPDITVVCDLSKIDEKGCRGVPDMIVEILSRATSKKDRTVKFNKYKDVGVKEYWIVDPDDRTLAVHLFRDGEYVSDAYADADWVPISVLHGCTINLEEVFPPYEDE